MNSPSHFQDQHRLKHLFRKRLFAVFLIIGLLSLALLGRLFYLQVIQHHYYTTLSANNRISLAPIAPARGIIYDRNGVVLAENLPAYTLVLVPDQIHNLAKTIQRLSKVISITPEDKTLFYKELQRKRSFEQVPLKTKLTQSEIAKFAVNKYQFPGVHVVEGLIRHYPFANDLVSVLGYVGRINASDLASVDESNYAATNYIGKVGIEKYFESDLHGVVGYRQVETDAAGREVRVLSETPPIPGNNIYLTIDSGLQEAALNAMKGDRGALVAIQPNSGQVLAMVSTPAYNPNAFVQGISDKAYKALQTSKDQPLYNRAIRGQFPFASTIKVFIALELLNGDYTTPSEQIWDPGYFRINDHSRIFHDEGKHGWVNLEKAIEVSCDVYFYKMSLRMGINPIDNILHKFGFGQYTHVQMNEELPGLVASPKWKLHTQQQKWYPGDTLNSTIGQGSMLTTPLQLASATATLAERGVRYQPNLLLKQVTANGQVIPSTPIKVGTIKIKPPVWQHVINGMIRVIKNNQGTGWRFGRNAPYSVAAKTGTGQVYSLHGQKYVLADVPLRLRDNSMFIAFAPVEHPKIAIAVAIQNKPNAPVVARRVLDYYLLKQKNLAQTETANLLTSVEPSHGA